MFSQLAQKLAYFFVEKNIVKSEEINIYIYGYEIMISETINWLITIAIATFTKTLVETFVYMLTFMQLRGVLGGFHAKSHMGCIIISTIVYMQYLYIIYRTPFNLYWILIPGGILLHMVLVFVIAPVSHSNKPFINEIERMKFRNRSYRLSILYGIVCVILLLIPQQVLKTYSYCILLGMLSASISMVVEYVKQLNSILVEGR